MSRRPRVRSSIKARPVVARKTFVEDPYAAYPNWEAFFFSSRYGGYSGGTDLGHDDWGRAQAYQLVGIVNRCMEVIATTVNSIPWNIVRKRGKERVIVSSSEEQSPTHPLARAINGVYAAQGIAFMKLLIYSRLQYGETYIEMVRNLWGDNPYMVWLNPYWTEPDTSTGRITYFRYGAKNGQQQEFLKPWQVAYEHTYNPTDNLRGLSKLDAAMYDINTSRGLKRFIKWTLDNNARPGLIATPKNDPQSPVTPMLGDTEANMLEAQLSDSHIGTRNASRAIVLKKPFDITTLEGPELEKYRALMQQFSKEITVVFGVPMSMAGDSSGTSYKDGEDVYDDAFINNTIKPHVKDNQDFINVHVMPFFDPSGECVLEYDLSAYEDTTEGDRAKADLIAVQQDKGWMTLADAQRAQGLPVYPEYEGLVMINGVITPLAQLGQMNAPLLPGLTPDISVTSPSIPQLPADAADPTKDAAGVSVTLSLSKNVDLLSLQRDLQVRLAGQPIKWNAPDSFHLTLVSAPVADDAALEQLIEHIKAYPPPEFHLNIGSLASFDRLNEHALHFRIRRDADLEAYQEDIFALCETLGIQTGQYSLPQNWKPHVTMGAALRRVPPITFQSRLRVSPDEVQVSVKRDGQYEIVGRVACGDGKAAAIGQEPAAPITPEQFAHAHHAPYVFEKALPVAEWRAKALKELDACQTRVKKGRKFQLEATQHLAADIDLSTITQENYVPFFDRLFMAVRYEPFKATLARVERAFNKDIGATRQEFEDEFLLAIADVKDGVLSAVQLEAVLNAVVDSLGEQGYIDGLEDGGIANPELDEDDRATISRLKAEARSFIADFVAKFDTYSDSQLDQRPKLWANKTLQGFYDHGLAAADANGIYVWRLGQTEDHCETCLAMNGIRKRMKNWLKDGILPQSDKLDCGGWNCDCGLFNIRGNAQGKTHVH